MNRPISTTISDAFWHLLAHPHILKIYALTFVFAVSLPFAAAYGYRLYRHLRTRFMSVPSPGRRNDGRHKNQSNEADLDPFSSLGKGGFNSEILDDLFIPLSQPPDKLSPEKKRSQPALDLASATLAEDDESLLCEEIDEEIEIDAAQQKDYGTLGDFSRSIAREVAQSMAKAAAVSSGSRAGLRCPFTGVCAESGEGVESPICPASLSKPKKDDDEDGDELSSLLGPEEKKTKFQNASWKIRPPPSAETMEALKKLEGEGLHGKLATARLRANSLQMEAKMSLEEREKERQIREQQITQIFEMMQQQGDKFGIKSEDQLFDQMKMYAV